MAHNNLGIGLRELNQADEALEHFRSAVELDPAFAPAQTNLGQMLLDLGQADEALPHSQEAVRLDPNSAVLASQPGQRAQDAGPACRRQGFLSGSVAVGSQLAPANAHLGLVLQREGQLADGLVWLKKAVELEPDKRRILGMAGRAVRRDGRTRRARSPVGSGWSPSSRIGPRRTSRSGWALQDEGRLAEARDHYDTAIRLQPDFGAAYLNLGGLHEELGKPFGSGRSLSDRARAAAACSRCPTPGWRRCCGASCPTKTWPRSRHD